MKWKIQSAGEIYDGGEESVIYYDPASGVTHLVSAFACHLIQIITANPSSTEQIVELLSSDIDPETSAEIQAAVPKMLSQLADIDLIQCH